MRELARWVKLSGTPDELQSLRYFQDKLDEYGYRTQLIMHDAYISLPGKARVDVDNQALSHQHHALVLAEFSCATRDRPAGLCVGDGDEADFAGRDLHGAIVLTLGGIASPGPGRARFACGGSGPKHRSAHTSTCTRCVRLAGLEQPVG